MLAAFLQRVGGWIGCLFGLRETVDDDREPAGTGNETVDDEGTLNREPVNEQASATHAEADLHARAETDGRARLQTPIQPEATEGTDAPLREAARQSLVPRWLAALRTQTFTGLAAIGLLLFGGLAALVTGGLTAGVDLATTEAVQSIAVPWFGPLMLGVSLFGFSPQSYLIVAGASALFWRAGYRTEAGFALAASASAILTEGIKAVVARPRPGADLVTVMGGADGHSFPSGHTLFYVTFFGFLAYLAYAHLKPGRLRTATLWLTGPLIVLVGPSRIWMGQHWASDVLASYALGLTYLVVLVQMYGRRRLGALTPPSEARPAVR